MQYVIFRNINFKTQHAFNAKMSDNYEQKPFYKQTFSQTADNLHFQTKNSKNSKPWKGNNKSKFNQPGNAVVPAAEFYKVTRELSAMKSLLGYMLENVEFQKSSMNQDQALKVYDQFKSFHLSKKTKQEREKCELAARLKEVELENARLKLEKSMSKSESTKDELSQVPVENDNNIEEISDEELENSNVPVVDSKNNESTEQVTKSVKNDVPVVDSKNNNELTEQVTKNGKTDVAVVDSKNNNESTAQVTKNVGEKVENQLLGEPSVVIR